MRKIRTWATEKQRELDREQREDGLASSDNIQASDRLLALLREHHSVTGVHHGS